MSTSSDQQLVHCWASHSPTSLAMTADLSLPECRFAGSRINTMPSRQGSCSPASEMCFRIWFNQDLLPQRQSFASRSVSSNTKHVFNLSTFLLCTTSADTQSKLAPLRNTSGSKSRAIFINLILILMSRD